MQQNRAVRAPADEYLIAPVDGPFRGAAVVLGKYSDELAACGLDPVGRAVAEVPQFPYHPRQLIDARGGDGLLGHANLLRPERDPNALPGREATKIIDQEIAADLGATHRDQSG